MLPALQFSDDYYLNYCAKYLARRNTEARHTYGCACETSDRRARISECWRFPIVDTHHDLAEPTRSTTNAVSFIYDARGCSVSTVAVTGTFASLHQRIPLQPVRFLGRETGYLATTVLVPKKQVHIYQFLVDDTPTLDPINIQRATLDNGRIWSRFFTDGCAVPLMLERWEFQLLGPLTAHILPFRTQTGELFLKQYYDRLDRHAIGSQYRFDQAVGVVNFIDKVIAREERHHYGDYRVALSLIRDVLRQRHPGCEPADAPREAFVELYEQLGSGDVPGWDYSRYHEPRYFLQLLRRHTYTGAFSHPRNGGNVLAAGWAFLADRYRDADGNTLFDWERALESPLGTSPDYRG
ncbi:Uncharacterized protein OS=Crinalium epipsammum PCC 9333 GN=Cri9333_0466 PE=4 SV=1: Gluconate_2-dh3 [Gemmataceae bacterium]|nr:Uncharacterized protein OS=Crinalium epipsammum PCC 9333 GN=Cri9333_0466 PE=4 SV=1: Gluconate_2-dh3 [Gemmataceae bacterium]VTT99802.1 Uncharacterized protein OS=Crinalium epipsammum PCC 9333 GN=Cri9333_0466 PE=4 SV=1: Gluconate_2-dh3 [Gemmataceae bacterium]